MTDLQDRVIKGSRLLDEKKPGWYEVIDLSNFWAADFYNDVLGQVFGSYEEGVMELMPPELFELADVRDAWVVAHGFDPSPEDLLLSEDTWTELTNLWLEVIVDHQENGADL